MLGPQGVRPGSPPIMPPQRRRIPGGQKFPGGSQAPGGAGQYHQIPPMNGQQFQPPTSMGNPGGGGMPGVPKGQTPTWNQVPGQPKPGFAPTPGTGQGPAMPANMGFKQPPTPFPGGLNSLLPRQPKPMGY